MKFHIKILRSPILSDELLSYDEVDSFKRFHDRSMNDTKIFFYNRMAHLGNVRPK